MEFQPKAPLNERADINSDRKLRLVRSAAEPSSPKNVSLASSEAALLGVNEQTPIAAFAKCAPLPSARALKITRISCASESGDPVDVGPAYLSETALAELHSQLIAARRQGNAVEVVVMRDNKSHRIVLECNADAFAFARRALRLARGEGEAITITAPEPNVDQEFYCSRLCDTFPGLYSSLSQLQQDIAIRIGVDEPSDIPDAAYCAWLSLLPTPSDLCSSDLEVRKRILCLVEGLASMPELTATGFFASEYLDQFRTAQSSVHASEPSALPALLLWEATTSALIFEKRTGTAVAAIDSADALMTAARRTEQEPNSSVEAAFTTLATYLDAVRHTATPTTACMVLQPLLRTPIPELSQPQLARLGKKLIDVIIEQQARQSAKSS